MRTFAGFLAACLFLSANVVSRGADEGPSKDIPELQALNHYAGKWDVTMSDGMKGEAVGRWVLNGRFLEQTAKLRTEPAPLELKTLMTYDQGKNKYRIWTFFSDGTTVAGEATWDEKSKTMTTTSKDTERNTTSTTTAVFSEADTEKWKIVSRDNSGQTFELSGTNNRKP